MEGPRHLAATDRQETVHGWPSGNALLRSFASGVARGCASAAGFSAEVRTIAGKSAAAQLALSVQLLAHSKGAFLMLQGAIVFFVLAIVAAFFGFSGIAASAAGIAKILALVFIVIAVVSFFFNKRARV